MKPSVWHSRCRYLLYVFVHDASDEGENRWTSHHRTANGVVKAIKQSMKIWEDRYIRAEVKVRPWP